MAVRVKHLAIPVSIIAGVGAALVTSAVAQSGGQRSTQAAPPFSQPGVVVPLATFLNGADENRPPNPTGDPAATGEALLTVNTGTNEVCVNFSATGLGTFNGFHIHQGGPTVRNGPIVIDFAPPVGATAPFSKCVVDTDAAAVAANPAGFYLNAHTATFPTGAISGQLDFRSAFSQTAQETQLLPAPYRAYDTRFNNLTKFAPSTTRTIDLTLSGIPVGARAAIVTVTVTRADAAGFIIVYSNALAAAPNTSNLNFSANEDHANNITVATDGANKIKITSGATGNEDVIVDVVGYVI
jgi:hypothetical protein